MNYWYALDASQPGHVGLRRFLILQQAHFCLLLQRLGRGSGTEVVAEAKARRVRHFKGIQIGGHGIILLLTAV